MHAKNKSMKIPQEQSEDVNRWKTDNILAKKTNNDLQNTTQKNKDQATQTHYNWGEIGCSGQVSISCSMLRTLGQLWKGYFRQIRK